MKLPRELIDYILKIRTQLAWKKYLARVHRLLEKRMMFKNFAEIHFRGELVYISRSKYNEFTVEVSHVPLAFGPIERTIIRRMILVKTVGAIPRRGKIYYRQAYLPSVQILSAE